MNENSIYWIFGAALVGLLIAFTGVLTGRKLPEKQRKMHRQKYAAYGLAFMFLFFPVFKPFVSSYSATQTLDTLRAENLTSTESLAKFEAQQTRQIERLKEEVEELRDDLYAVNLYYSALIQFFSTIAAVLLINFAFRKGKEEAEGEPSENIFNL